MSKVYSQVAKLFYWFICWHIFCAHFIVHFGNIKILLAAFTKCDTHWFCSNYQNALHVSNKIQIMSSFSQMCHIMQSSSASKNSTSTDEAIWSLDHFSSSENDLKVIEVNNLCIKKLKSLICEIQNWHFCVAFFCFASLSLARCNLL